MLVLELVLVKTITYNKYHCDNCKINLIRKINKISHDCKINEILRHDCKINEVRYDCQIKKIHKIYHRK